MGAQGRAEGAGPPAPPGGALPRSGPASCRAGRAGPGLSSRGSRGMRPLARPLSTFRRHRNVNRVFTARPERTSSVPPVREGRAAARAAPSPAAEPAEPRVEVTALSAGRPGGPSTRARAGALGDQVWFRKVGVTKSSLRRPQEGRPRVEGRQDPPLPHQLQGTRSSDPEMCPPSGHTGWVARPGEKGRAEHPVWGWVLSDRPGSDCKPKSKHFVPSTTAGRASGPVPELNSGSSEVNKATPGLEELTL